MSVITEATAAPSWADVTVGTVLPEQTTVLRLQDEVRYCGAGLDFVGVHWSDRIARSVGLPAVVAHGPLTVAIALRAVQAWTGDPTAVREYEARFLRPIALPDDGTEVTLRVSGAVQEKLDGRQVAVALQVTSATDDEKVATVRAVVRLP